MRVLRRILVLVPALCLCLFATGQNTSEQESRKAQLEKEIAQIQKQLRENTSKSAGALNELTLIRKQISNRRTLVQESDREIRIISDSIRVAQSRYDALRARLDTMTVYYRKLIRGAYRNRDTRLWYVYVLSSGDVGQASRRYSYLKNMASQMNTQALKIKEMQASLEAELASLEAMKRRAESMRAERQRALDNLRKEEKRSDTLVANLKKDKTRYQKQLNSKRKQVEALNREIERIIAQYMEESRRKSSGKQPSSQVDYRLAAEFEANKGKLPWPADGPVVEKFGKHKHPVYTSLVMPFNNGIGISLSPGTEVQAVFDGEVRRVIVMPGYNRCVLVQHGSYFTFYCKLDEVSVKAGDKVKTGQSIGKVDTIDGQTRLHFQVWKEKTPQNPESWLRPR